MCSLSFACAGFWSLWRFLLLVLRLFVLYVLALHWPSHHLSVPLFARQWTCAWPIVVVYANVAPRGIGQMTHSGCVKATRPSRGREAVPSWGEDPCGTTLVSVGDTCLHCLRCLRAQKTYP